MHWSLRILTIGCSIFLMLGCRTVSTPPAIVALPAESAPEIPLHFASSSRRVGIDVQFDDQRPDYERRYYPGTCEPRRWHDAMSVVPLESFVPGIQGQLCRQVAETIEAKSSDIKHVTIALTSFQFAFDQREDIEGEYRAMYANWSADNDKKDVELEAHRAENKAKRWESQERENNEDASFGSYVAGEMMMFGFTTLFIDLPRSMVRNRVASRKAVAEPQMLPAEITEGKHSGLNCQIHAVLTLTDRFGIEEQREVHINRHAPVTAHGSLKDQAAAFIETALEEFSASL